jgi:hypothetical protein
VTRRASLPGADVLFRSTARPEPAQESANREQGIAPEPVELEVDENAHARQGGVYGEEPSAPTLQDAQSGTVPEAPKPKHAQKVTFYCTDEELTRLERARLALRAEHRLACDRGRLVRAALAEVLDEFEAAGKSSALVRRLGKD